MAVTDSVMTTPDADARTMYHTQELYRDYTGGVLTQRGVGDRWWISDILNMLDNAPTYHIPHKTGGILHATINDFSNEDYEKT